MNSSITTLGPEIVIEIYRSKGVDDRYGGHYRESFGFHILEPTADTTYWTQPFAGPIDAVPTDPQTGLVKDSPIYKEISGNLVSPESRVERQEELVKAGFKAFQLDQVPENFRHYVIHCQAPIEWHGPLDDGEVELTSRVRIFVKGEFPS